MLGLDSTPMWYRLMSENQSSTRYTHMIDSRLEDTLDWGRRFWARSSLSVLNYIVAVRLYRSEDLVNTRRYPDARDLIDTPRVSGASALTWSNLYRSAADLSESSI